MPMSTFSKESAARSSRVPRRSSSVLAPISTDSVRPIPYLRRVLSTSTVRRYVSSGPSYPVAAAVQGAAMGGGLGLASSAGLRVATLAAASQQTLLDLASVTASSSQ
jgi:hypothetical protein